MTSPEPDYAGWAAAGRRVIVRDLAGNERLRGVATSYVPPSGPTMYVRADDSGATTGGSTSGAVPVTSAPASLVELEGDEPAAAVDALAAINGITTAKARQAIAALRRAGYSVERRGEQVAADLGEQIGGIGSTIRDALGPIRRP